MVSICVSPCWSRRVPERSRLTSAASVATFSRLTAEARATLSGRARTTLPEVGRRRGVGRRGRLYRRLCDGDVDLCAEARHDGEEGQLVGIDADAQLADDFAHAWRRRCRVCVARRISAQLVVECAHNWI